MNTQYLFVKKILGRFTSFYLLVVISSDVWYKNFGLYFATSESIRIDAKKLKVVLDKDPFGSKVLKRYVESITAERKAEKNSRIMKSKSK